MTDRMAKTENDTTNKTARLRAAWIVWTIPILTLPVNSTSCKYHHLRLILYLFR